MKSQQCVRTPQPDAFIPQYRPSRWQSSEAGSATPSALEPAASRGLLLAGGKPESLNRSQTAVGHLPPELTRPPEGHSNLMCAASSLTFSCPGSEMCFIWQYLYTVLQCSRAVVVLVKTDPTCLAGVFLNALRDICKENAVTGWWRKAFGPGRAWDRAVLRGGWGWRGSRRSRCRERGWSSRPRALQAERAFGGPFLLYCKRKQEGWQIGLRRCHWFSAYLKKWAEFSGFWQRAGKIR